MLWIFTLQPAGVPRGGTNRSKPEPTRTTVNKLFVRLSIRQPGHQYCVYVSYTLLRGFKFQKDAHENPAIRVTRSLRVFWVKYRARVDGPSRVRSLNGGCGSSVRLLGMLTVVLLGPFTSTLAMYYNSGYYKLAFGLWALFLSARMKVWRLAQTQFPRHEDDSAHPEEAAQLRRGDQAPNEQLNAVRSRHGLNSITWGTPPDRSKTKTQMFIPLHVNLRPNYSKWRPYLEQCRRKK